MDRNPKSLKALGLYSQRGVCSFRLDGLGESRRMLCRLSSLVEKGRNDMWYGWMLDEIFVFWGDVWSGTGEGENRMDG